MAKTISAIVTPEVLSWARNLDRISVDEAASRLRVKADKIQAWEEGSSYPTLRQAKELAKYYRVPFVTFYLPDPPKKAKRIERVDYRTFGNIGDQFFISRELRWLLRDIEDRRDTMLELYAIDGRKPKAFPLHLKDASIPEQIALEVRKLLGLRPSVQKTFRKPEKALTYCLEVLEHLDVLVFQATKIDTKEMRGLSLSYDVMPIIVLNRKDEYSARLFTLIHELVHLILGNSGICTDIGSDSIAANEIELLCNKVAGLVLAPEDEVLNHPALQKIKEFGFNDTYINSMARDFATSKEVIIHQLYSLGIITKSFYYDTLSRYGDEYKNRAAKKKSGQIPPAIDKGTQVGRLYARTVLNAYHGDKISASDASAYLLNLGAKHFGRVERWCV